MCRTSTTSPCRGPAADTKDTPWYSLNIGNVHVTVMSTENPWDAASAQYAWLQQDLAAVDRAATPWVPFAGHREPYTSVSSDAFVSFFTGAPVDPNFPPVIEPLLRDGGVDVARAQLRAHVPRVSPGVRAGGRRGRVGGGQLRGASWRAGPRRRRHRGLLARRLQLHATDLEQSERICIRLRAN